MAKIGIVGGPNPHPDTHGRSGFLGPLAYELLGTNKTYPSGNTIPVNPVYSNQGIPRNAYWSEHGGAYWEVSGKSVFSAEGITMTQLSGAKTESRTALYVGVSPKNKNFKVNAICPIFPGNGTPGFVGISFDWERYDRRHDSHRNKIWKVGFIYRNGENSVAFSDCSSKTTYTPVPTGDLRIFRFRESGEYQTQSGSVYCPVRLTENTSQDLADFGQHNVVGVAIQFNKEGGFNPEQSTQVGSYMTVKNLAIHTAGDKRLIIPRKQAYPTHLQHPTGRDEIFVW